MGMVFLERNRALLTKQERDELDDNLQVRVFKELARKQDRGFQPPSRLPQRHPRPRCARECGLFGPHGRLRWPLLFVCYCLFAARQTRETCAGPRREAG